MGEIDAQAEEVVPVMPMPVKAAPYKHQIEAFNLAMRLFGLAASDAAKSSGSSCKTYNNAQDSANRIQGNTWTFYPN